MAFFLRASEMLTAGITGAFNLVKYFLASKSKAARFVIAMSVIITIYLHVSCDGDDVESCVNRFIYTLGVVNEAISN